MVGVHQGQPTYIRDVALVTEGTDDATSMVAYYTGPAYGAHGEHGEVSARTLAPLGAPAVTIAVAKKAGSNGVSVANQVLAQIHLYQAGFADLPAAEKPAHISRP